MSSTGRGADRLSHDYYPTPTWCVHRMTEHIILPSGRWLEPCAGDGAVIRAFDGWAIPDEWTAVEIQPDFHCALQDVARWAMIGDFLAGGSTTPPQHASMPPRKFDVAISNPPYNLAQEVVEKCLKISRHTVMLLRVGFLGSVKRRSFLMANPPNVYILPNRPSFTGHGTDSCDYAWFHWGPDPGGRWCILNETPLKERKNGQKKKE